VNEERTMVLEMLAAGKITIEQANQLIDVLGEKPLSTEEEWTIKRQRSESREPVQPYRDQQQAPGLTQFTFDQIIELSEHEVDPAYLKGLREAGLTDLSVEQIIELSEHDVEPSYLIKLRQAGLTDLSLDQIIELSEHEVDPAYLVKFREGGIFRGHVL